MRRPYDHKRDATPERREKHRLSQAAYNATFRGWETKLRSRMKGQRETVLAKLDALKKEEAECLKLLERATAKKSSGQGQST